MQFLKRIPVLALKDIRPIARVCYSKCAAKKERKRPMWIPTSYPCVPAAVLNSGHEMPLLGLGTFLSPKGEVCQAVKDAIDIGYRHIDCAFVYQNENEVGAGIKAKIDECVVKREDLFITSKLWNTFHSPDLVRGALEASLKLLKLEYVDMYLIHWPTGYKEGDALFPEDDCGKTLFSDVDYVETWKAMEKLVEAGLTKSIGVSNFNKRQIERILKVAKIPPATNQVECHPYLSQKKLGEFCRGNDIVLTAYSPLGSPQRPWGKPNDPVLMEDQVVCGIACKHKKSPAQILLRYQVQQGNIAIPKSVNKQRIAANMQIFDFELSKEELAALDNLNCNGRYVPLLSALGHPHHPFEKDDF